MSSQKRKTRQQREEQQMRLIPMISGHTDVDCIQVGKMISQTESPMIDDGIIKTHGSESRGQGK